ncbi:MAG: o-succinylbenzoate--CoA ligase [Candidatus Hydrogenedentes bacterium]|nr:o-succinylbenzoate--CoA ligase [Candidatus Hydrogenedentota bacterium]
MSDVVWPMAIAANRFGESPALSDRDSSYTYREMASLVAGVAGALRVAGIGPGDRVAIAAASSASYVLILHACFQLGAVACPLNTRLPRQALSELIQSIGAMALLVDEYFSVIKLGHIATLRVEHLIEEAYEGAAPAPPHSLNRPATVVSSSGSTGTPKHVLHSYANHWFNASASNENIPVEPGDRWLLSLPLFHVSGLGILFRCMLGGGTVVVPGIGEALEDSIPAHRITHVSLVATQLFRLLRSRSGREALRRLRVILLGGSSIPAPLIREAKDQNLPIYVSYGLTEMASQVSTSRRDAPLEALLSSGKPLVPNTVTVAPDKEVMVRGRTLFMGYLEGSVIRLPLGEDGWFATGDLGRFDEDGNLHILGRKDNMFISGGENVHPEEIERHLCRAPGVVQALVVPVPCPEFGVRPAAFVRMDERHLLDPRELEAALLDGLPKFMVPVLFLPWPDDNESAGIKDNRGLFAELATRHRKNP